MSNASIFHPLKILKKNYTHHHAISLAKQPSKSLFFLLFNPLTSTFGTVLVKLVLKRF